MKIYCFYGEKQALTVVATFCQTAAAATKTAELKCSALRVD